MVPVIPELGESIVARPRRLATLLSHDSHANVCCLDHAHIICSVPDAQAYLFEIILDETNNERLLNWRHAAADHLLPYYNWQMEEGVGVPFHSVLQNSRDPFYIWAE